MRQEFLNHTFGEIRSTLEAWQRRVGRADLKGIQSVLADDVMFAPLEGWIGRGKAEAAESLAVYFPRQVSAAQQVPITRSQIAT